jgi:hypothetical protein
MSDYLYKPLDSNCEASSPRLDISLDLPACKGYLPTYWPGQSINGKLLVQSNTPIKVFHLRIAFYGSVQVCGKERTMPLTGGLFDYHKNVQLLNRGLRIVKKHKEHDSALQNQALGVISDYQQSTLNEEQNEMLLFQAEATEKERHKAQCGRQETVQVTEPKRKKKSEEERRIERLIKQIADTDFDKDTSYGTIESKDLTYACFNDKSSVFELEANTHNVRFSIHVPISRKLPGTFDHPNYPISYRLVAIMNCFDNDQKEILCYSTAKVRLEPMMNDTWQEFCSCAQSSETSLLISDNSNIFKSFCNYVLSCSSLLTKSRYSKAHANVLPEAMPLCSSNQLQSYIELPTQVFGRSEMLPLKVKLLNTSIHFKISVLKINVQLSQRIVMTCGFGETTESKALMSKRFVFNSADETPSGYDEHFTFFDCNNMCFDLTGLLHVPPSCAYSIPSNSTKEVYSLVHDISVNLEIEGIIRAKTINPEPKLDMTEVIYFAREDNIFVHERNQAVKKLNIQGDRVYKSYRMHLNPLQVFVDHSGYAL